MKKNNKNKHAAKKIILIFLFIVILTLIASAVSFNNTYKDKMLFNININGEEYSKLTKEEAADKLRNRINDATKDGFVFTFKNKTYKKASYDEIGASVDINPTISEAFRYGHGGELADNINDVIQLLDKKVDLWIAPVIDDKIFDEFISKEISRIENPPKNFNYENKQGEFVPIAAKSGMVIDKEKIKNDILNNISRFKNNPVEIELMKKEAELKEDAGGKALLAANNLLNKKLVLKYNSSSWELQKEELMPFIKFDAVESEFEKNKILGVAANKEKIKDYLVSLVPQINQKPVNAVLESKNGKFQIFSLDRDGIALQIGKSNDEIEKNIFTPQNYRDNSEKKVEVQLITEEVKPEITIESIDNMGITALLATGESDFSNSPKNRRHNIAVGAEKYQGVLIGPGDEFSFVKILGNVGPKEGYLPELVIKKGQTIPEYGGGLCQVSTTAFRAAVKAGLEITERKNHAYPVKYYNPQGTDATIYPPSPDLKFKNNTPAYILIQTRVEKNKLYFDFYGSDDGRKVVLDDPVVYDKKSDGSMKATWTQKVYYKNGELRFEKKFYSVYKSPALYPHNNPLE